MVLSMAALWVEMMDAM
jgi:hypothetical protein